MYSPTWDWHRNFAVGRFKELIPTLREGQGDNIYGYNICNPLVARLAESSFLLILDTMKGFLHPSLNVVINQFIRSITQNLCDCSRLFGVDVLNLLTEGAALCSAFPFCNRPNFGILEKTWKRYYKTYDYLSYAQLWSYNFKSVSYLINM